MPEDASGGWLQQALEGASDGGWQAGLALCRQQGMLQFSPPAQAGDAAATRISSARTTWMHRVANEFIVRNYKNISGCMSTGQARHTALPRKSFHVAVHFLFVGAAFQPRCSKLKVSFKIPRLKQNDSKIHIVDSNLSFC
jgi:hypothetical protein